MKQTLTIILLIAGSAGLAPAEITLKGGLFNSLRYSVDGETYHTISNSGKELLDIMEGNFPAQDEIRSYAGRRRSAIILGVVGGASLGWPIGWSAGGGEWEDYHNVMIVSGVLLGLASVLSESSAVAHLREGVRIYNQTYGRSSKDDWPPEFTTSVSQAVLRISVSVNL